MAVVFSSDFETANFTDWTTKVGSPVQDTGTVRAGANSLKAAAANTYVTETVTGLGTGAFYYARIYARWDATPAAIINLLTLWNSAVGVAAGGYAVSLKTDGKLYLRVGTTDIGTPSAALSAGAWYMIELKVGLNTGASSKDFAELRLNGTVVTTENNTTDRISAVNRLSVGVTNANNPSANLFIDALSLDNAAYPGPITTTYTDSQPGTLVSSGSATETRTATDSGSGTITAAGSSTETKLYPDSQSGALALSGPSTASHTGSDSRAGTVTLTATAAESLTFTSSGAGTLTAGGTASETKRHADSGAATFTASGTATGVHRGSDSATAAIVLSGGAEERSTRPAGQMDMSTTATATSLTTAATARDGADVAQGDDGRSTSSLVEGRSVAIGVD